MDSTYSLDMALAVACSMFSPALVLTDARGDAPCPSDGTVSLEVAMSLGTDCFDGRDAFGARSRSDRICSSALKSSREYAPRNAQVLKCGSRSIESSDVNVLNLARVWSIIESGRIATSGRKEEDLSSRAKYS